MLDSGAYSAWYRGEAINIDDYIAFVKANLHLISEYVNLDVIPGKYGERVTREQVEESAQKSYDNLKYMQRHGLRPIPVFHQGEGMHWLRRLVDEGEDYIGISPTEGLPQSAIRQWLDRVFSVITRDDGSPIVRTHGFGVMAFNLIWRYPWTTCDSTTWSLLPGYGRILMPKYVGGKPRYDLPPTTVIISDAKRLSANATDYALMGPVQRQRIQMFLDEVGVTLLDARNDDNARRRCVLHFLVRMSQARSDVRFKHRVQELT
jgi:hypothetical protein